MGDFRKSEVAPLPERDPKPVFDQRELVFTPEEKRLIAGFVDQYEKKEGAVMKALWLAQEKFGYLPPEVIGLVADEIDIPYAHAYGVATFYTQYYKKKMGKYVLDVCTCFSCQLCGGYDMLHYLEEKLEIKKGETTGDGMFSIQEVECLGACGSAPMLQVTNGPYVNHMSRKKVDRLIDDLRAGRTPAFTSVTLPQDEDEMHGNRRSDVDLVDAYRTPPVAESVD